MALMDRSQFTGYFKFTVGTKVCAHTWVGNSRVPWHVALDHTTPTQALLSMDGHQTIVVKGKYDERCLIQPLGSTEWEYCHLASS